MTHKLIQKHFLHGTQEFELLDDKIKVRINSLLKGKKEHDVVLAMLNPEPVISKSRLDFHSRVKCRPLLSLYLNKPNSEEFNDFVNTLKQRAQTEYNAIAGISVAAKTTLNGNVYEEPPEFSDTSPADISKDKTINVEEVENAISMLETYVKNEAVYSLIAALESLKLAPEDHSKLVEVATVFNELGSSQGAVLTYAPYIGILLSDDSFGPGENQKKAPKPFSSE